MRGEAGQSPVPTAPWSDFSSPQDPLLPSAGDLEVSTVPIPPRLPDDTPWNSAAQSSHNCEQSFTILSRTGPTLAAQATIDKWQSLRCVSLVKSFLQGLPLPIHGTWLSIAPFPQNLYNGIPAGPSDPFRGPWPPQVKKFLTSVDSSFHHCLRLHHKFDRRGWMECSIAGKLCEWETDLTRCHQNKAAGHRKRCRGLGAGEQGEETRRSPEGLTHPASSSSQRQKWGLASLFSAHWLLYFKLP